MPPRFLYLRKSSVADISVIAAPANNGGINVNELSFVVKIIANCATIPHKASGEMNRYDPLSNELIPYKWDLVHK